MLKEDDFRMKSSRINFLLRLKIIQLSIIIACLVFPITSYSFNNYQSDQDQKTDEERDQKESESNLNLPDVIIYGEEKSVKKTGRKIKAKEENVNLLDNDVKYHPSIYQPKLSPNKLFLSDEQKQSQISNIATFKFGSFNTPYLMLKRSQESEYYDYSASGTYQHSDGQFDNSQFSIGEANLQFDLNINPEFETTLAGNVYYSEYGLHGANIAGLKRKLTFGIAKFYSQWFLSSSSTASIDILLRQFNSSDKTSAKSKLDEQTAGITGNFNRKFENYLLSVNAHYFHNSYRANEYFNLNAGLTFPFSHFFSLNSSIAVEKVTSQHERLSPSLKLIFTPNARLGLSLKGSRYFNPQYCYDLWHQNPYISNNLNLIPENIKFDFTIDAEYRVLNELIVDAQISRRWIDDYSYWQREMITGVFELNQLNNIAITQLSGGVRYNFADRFVIHSQLSFFIDTIDNDSLAAADFAIPYLEAFRATTRLQTIFRRSILFEINSAWIGRRYTTLTKDNKLDDFFFIEIKVEKQMNSYLNILLGCKNLLNSEYDLWENYREMGLRFFIGLEGKW